MHLNDSNKALFIFEIVKTQYIFKKSINVFVSKHF